MDVSLSTPTVEADAPRSGPKMRKAFPIAVVLFLMAILPPSPVGAAKALFSTATGKPVTLSELVDDLSDAPVIIFGERHNNPDDHTAQRTLLQALHDAGYRVALGLEMFRAESQPRLDAWIGGGLDEREFAFLFADNWNQNDFAVYHPLFYYARQEGIPLVGLNVARELPAKVGKDGFDSLTRKEKELVGQVSCDIDENYKRLLARAMGEKRVDSGKFGRFCEAQVLWDASMAANAAKFIKKNPRKKLLILAGTYHAWKYGIPEQLSKSHGIGSVVILPSDDAAFINYKVLADEADYVWSSQ